MRNCITTCLFGLAGAGTLGAQFLELAVPVLRDEVPVARPRARLETVPVNHTGDAADDPAVWVHPTDPRKSLILGTNKQDGLMVYGMDGKVRSVVDSGLRPNNVDVKYGIKFGGKTWDVAAAAMRGTQRGLRVWKIDRTGKLSPATPVVPVLAGVEPYGSTLYRRAKDGALFAFVNDKTGFVEQYALTDDGKGGLRAARVRRWDVGTQVEGCVADDEYGWFYVGEEDVAIWRYDADPGAPTDPKSRYKVIGLDTYPRFKPDVEGLTIYYAAGGAGYLLASIQGEHRFFVFDRRGYNCLTRIFDPVATSAIDDVDETDGLCVVNMPTSGLFPFGMVVVQDHTNTNPAGNQNFKCYGWEDIAGAGLIIDRKYDLRRPVWRG